MFHFLLDSPLRCAILASKSPCLKKVLYPLVFHFLILAYKSNIPSTRVLYQKHESGNVNSLRSTIILKSNLIAVGHSALPRPLPQLQQLCPFTRSAPAPLPCPLFLEPFSSFQTQHLTLPLPSAFDSLPPNLQMSNSFSSSGLRSDVIFLNRFLHP